MRTGNRYLNVRSNALVDTFNEGHGRITIATVRPDGYGPKRRVKADSFHPHYLDEDNRPHKSGYVPVNTLPGDHPHALTTEASVDDILDHLDELSNEELARFIKEQQDIASRAEEAAKKAKAVAKGREKDGGVKVYGDVTMEYTPNRRFDEATARRNLSPEDFQSICLMKADASLAKAFFKNSPEKLERCKKDNGWTLSVRAATDEDREKAARAKGETPRGDEFGDFGISIEP